MTLRRPQRVAGFSYRGPHQYLLTFCTAKKRLIFTADPTATAVLLQFYRVARDERFEILAYCLMPDHVHLVVEGRADTSDLRRFVRMAKQRAACALWTERRLTGVWQEGFHDWVVRAGLVADWTRYEYSGTSIPLAGR